jgi:hypothetical protein
MNIQEEQRRGCVDSIVVGLTKTSDFRLRKAKQYPDDHRNAAASESLKIMAKNASQLSDESWRLLQLYYAPDSKDWRDAICQATKDIGFSNKSRSVAYFIQRLIRILSQPTSVAA